MMLLLVFVSDCPSHWWDWLGQCSNQENHLLGNVNRRHSACRHPSSFCTQYVHLECSQLVNSSFGINICSLQDDNTDM